MMAAVLVVDVVVTGIRASGRCRGGDDGKLMVTDRRLLGVNLDKKGKSNQGKQNG